MEENKCNPSQQWKTQQGCHLLISGNSVVQGASQCPVRRTRLQRVQRPPTSGWSCFQKVLGPQEEDTQNPGPSLDFFFLTQPGTPPAHRPAASAKKPTQRPGDTETPGEEAEVPSVRSLPSERQRSGEMVWKAGDVFGAVNMGEPERQYGCAPLLAGAGAP